APLQDARVTIMRRMPGMEHPEDKDMLIAEATGPGQYTTHTAFAMGGKWNVIVTVASEQTDAQPLTFSLEVEQP
ncbi:MAG: FixH family protein, partial [Chloroflexaceae bacterium]|nr:FixH family protein [Chloroflexaceae bacterium]